ncbi:MAG: MFS transporter [Rhabdochlamydiaceae bacterium]|nr:MFS transporter [Candidatus Amphrikana amoebophyrae]
MNQARRREIISWCLFDSGQSAFSTIIVTFVFSAYFAKMVAPSEVQGISDFGWALSFSGLLVAIISPFLGAIADHTSKKKPWIFTFTLLGICATASLFFVQPSSKFLFLALGLFVLANTIVEMTQVFYNAYLPILAPQRKIGAISGFGWGSGYIGGLFALVIALALFVQAHFISHENSLNIRSTMLLAAGWMFLFCAPFFIFVKDHYFLQKSEKHVVQSGIKNVFTTIKAARKHKEMFRFLIARLLYTDGINTLLSLGGVFAAIIFDMPFEELLMFGISMNISAGFGAFVLAKFDDKIGSAKMILLTLVAIIVFGMGIIVTRDKMIFWLIALILGLFIGPVQAASRSFMAHLAPKKMMTQMFGLYALSGKVTSFIAPFFVATITRITHSERLGMSAVFVLMAIGAIILLPIIKRK